MTDLEAAAALGVNAGAVQHVQAAPSLAEAQARLDELKREAKRRHRQMALEHHPDRTGGDDSVMKTLNRVMDDLEKVAIKVRPLPQPVVVRVYASSWSHSSTSSTTAGCGWTR